ncbi:hypothetical protein WICPIJ_007878 [Wickerhamomyces pijperi]|uniref:SET domain-containing protein n=1 Tax=Wickerhamomyces pijperi TaxID=599730 RepID=A0A9P8TIU8_WICPI|nr:hypothetical protein WICPIJ_007878 [Wickerhamomyces pijperi]
MVDNTDINSTSQDPSTLPTRSSSILEDASTLLMFHNSAVNASAPVLVPVPAPAPLPAPINEVSASMLPSSTSSSAPLNPPESPPISRQPNLSSPGPAIAALASFSNENQGYSTKGMIAADALAAAIEVSAQRLSQPAQRSVPVQGGFEIESRVDSNVTVEEGTGSADETRAEGGDDHDDADAADDDVPVKESEKGPKDPPQSRTTQTSKESTGKPTREKKPRKPINEPSNPQAEAALSLQFSKNPSEYKVDPDSGIISCICEVEEDDGYTIQCDKCFRWQHIYCMGIGSIDDAPDDFMCNACQPRPLNAKKARAHQLQRLSSARKRKERRGKNPEEDEEEAEATENGNERSKEEDSKTKESKPPRNSKPLNPYGKNLEEADIKVLPPRDQYKTTYNHLTDYEYSDPKVLAYIKRAMGIPANGATISKSQLELTNFPSIKVKTYTDASNKKFNGITKTALFTDDLIPQNSLVGEYLGTVGFKNSYMHDSRNHYRIWGVEKPNVLFVPGTDIVIDARFSGNLTRFIRRSCHPNCELIVLKVGDKHKFMLNSLKPIKSGSELTVAWNWDNHHPIKYIINGQPFDATNDADKPTLVLSVESILNFVECACSSAAECYLSKVKKASSIMYRANRKGTPSKLIKKERVYTPIEERLDKERQINLADSLEVVKSFDEEADSKSETAAVLAAEINIKPFVYGYLSKKRRHLDVIDANEIPTLKDYLPIPFEVEKKPDLKTAGEIAEGSAAPVTNKPKKLSFADYYKKKKTGPV